MLANGLSVIIPGRNEMFFRKTVENVLENMRGDTEIIAICDGSWPDPPIDDHPRVHVIHFAEPVGQRAAVNIGAGLSRAKYIMKLDAHCAVDEGFDEKLMKHCDYETTVIPRMYNLHGFDWVCPDGHRRYQSPPGPCLEPGCGKETVREIIWKPRLARRTDFARFDKTPQFQYWGAYKDRPAAQGKDCDVMCSVGAAFFMHRKRFFDLGGMDEAHGSWGQFGLEVACKAWLSGGRHLVNKRTWFSHMFRTQNEGFGFPYPISHQAQERARQHSRWLWIDGNWPKAVHPLSWLVEKFAPVPGWHDSPG